MPAFALQSAVACPRLIRRQPEAFMAQSPEAQQISARTSDVLSHLSKTKTYESAAIDAIKLLLEHGFHELICKTNQVKKSVIITENGDEVYRLNSSFGGLRDIWKAFCHLNAMKF